MSVNQKLLLTMRPTKHLLFQFNTGLLDLVAQPAVNDVRQRNLQK